MLIKEVIKMNKYIKMCGLGLILLFLQGTIDALSIAVTPANIDKKITEYDNIIPITVKNHSSEPLQYYIYASSLGQKLDGEAIADNGTITPFSLVNYIKFEPYKFILEPNASQIVKATIQIPTNAVGGLYGIIYVEAHALSEQLTGEAKGVISFVPRVGIITLLTLATPAAYSAKITQIDITQDRLSKEVFIMPTLHNNGNIHLRAEGYVSIKNLDGEKIANVFITPGVILPGYLRQLKAIWKPKNLLPGSYTAEINITFSSKALICSTSFEAINNNEIAIVSGKIVNFAEIRTVQHKPISFKLLFSNDGNINLFTSGEIGIKNLQDELIISVPIAPKEILPYSSEELIANLETGLPMGSYTAIVKINYSDKLSTAMTYINVIEKEIIEAGEVIEFSIEQLPEQGLILSKLLFKNTGNITLYVEGLIELKNSAGITIGQIVIDRVAIEPEKVSQIIKSWQGKLPVGVYKGIATLIFGEGKKIIKVKESSFLILK